MGGIVDRTDGVPLFIEELTKSVLEGGLLSEEVDRYLLDGALPCQQAPSAASATARFFGLIHKEIEVFPDPIGKPLFCRSLESLRVLPAQ